MQQDTIAPDFYRRIYPEAHATYAAVSPSAATEAWRSEIRATLDR